jgi:hypothetical protein
MPSLKPRIPRQPLGRRLSVFPGTWKASFRWLAKEALVVMRSRVGGGPPASISTIGGDDATKSYCMLYSDERGVARHYAMTLTSRVWQLTRHAPGFSQRFVGRFSADRCTIRGAWKKSPDGVRWEHDFAITYTKRP